MALFFLMVNFSSYAITSIPFWGNGFNDNAYRHCKAYFTQCPVDGVFPNEKCVANIIKQHSTCHQLQLIAKQMGVVPASIDVASHNHFAVVTVYYPADGQSEGYLVTPRGVLYGSHVDIRKLNPDVARQFKGRDFYITNWSGWTAFTDRRHFDHFKITQKITDTCLACETITFATLEYIFDAKGDFVGRQANILALPVNME
ncbi:MAG: hypothetical protein A3F10_01965 [Coxiella sp. RIFCSPHIGHO2_12_FULL_42_15]|nr:MAG: hypothetical protein A3F10_01965 [Coxiella sp. RIFCSPHIGHO2_12_FULL_42_15]